MAEEQLKFVLSREGMRRSALDMEVAIRDLLLELPLSDQTKESFEEEWTILEKDILNLLTTRKIRKIMIIGDGDPLVSINIVYGEFATQDEANHELLSNFTQTEYQFHLLLSEDTPKTSLPSSQSYLLFRFEVESATEKGKEDLQVGTEGLLAILEQIGRENDDNYVLEFASFARPLKFDVIGAWILPPSGESSSEFRQIDHKATREEIISQVNELVRSSGIWSFVLGLRAKPDRTNPRFEFSEDFQDRIKEHRLDPVLHWAVFRRTERV